MGLDLALWILNLFGYKGELGGDVFFRQLLKEEAGLLGDFVVLCNPSWAGPYTSKPMGERPLNVFLCARRSSVKCFAWSGDGGLLEVACWGAVTDAEEETV